MSQSCQQSIPLKPQGKTEQSSQEQKTAFNVSQLLTFTRWRRVPIILQSEAGECGLAVITMLANFYGFKTDLVTLRQHFGMSLKGANLAQLMTVAKDLNLSSRALRLDLYDIKNLTTPCVLHWDLNHFVVLTKVHKHKVTIVDPAVGERVMSLDELGNHFTGVALELSPNKAFKKQKQMTKMRLSDFYQSSSGLFSSLLKVFILSLLLQMFALAGPYYMQLVVDEVLLSNDQNLLMVLAIGFGLLALIEMATKALRSTVLLHFSNVLNIQMAANLFSHLLRLPLDFFEKRHIGDVLSRFSSLGKVKDILTTGIIETLIDGVMALATLTMICLYSIKLAAIVVIALIAYTLVRCILYKPIKQLSEEAIIAKAKEQSNFMESVRAIQTIKLFGRENQRQNLWHNAYAEQLNCTIRLGKYEIHFNWLNDFIFGLENVLVIFFAATLIMQGQLSVGMLFAFMSYKRQFISKMVNVIEKLIEFKMLSLHLNRLADLALCQPERLSHMPDQVPDQVSINNTERSGLLCDEPKEIDAPSNANCDGGCVGGCDEGSEDGNKPAQHYHPTCAEHQPKSSILTLNNVHFAYHKTEALIFNQLSLNLLHGQSIAIIGPSGCGKTTLMKLMLGLFQCATGSVCFKGVDIKHLGLQGYRQQVGAVMQDDQLLSGSIVDNISFFDEHVDFMRVQQVAKMAAIDDEINAMPMRYNSLVGDMGSALSGGQKQRLLLARSLYKCPEILFLDEATSHLDTELEARVNMAIKQLNITRVIIAHRIETILTADTIYALQQGILVDVTQSIKKQYQATCYKVENSPLR